MEVQVDGTDTAIVVESAELVEITEDEGEVAVQEVVVGEEVDTNTPGPSSSCLDAGDSSPAHELADLTHLISNTHKPLNVQGHSWPSIDATTVPNEASVSSKPDSNGEKASLGVLCGSRYYTFKQCEEMMKAQESDSEEEEVTLHCCDICGDLFKSETALGRHVKIHQGMVKCPICPAMFQHKSLKTYYKHFQKCLRTVRRTRLLGVFQCCYCNAEFNRISKFNVHLLYQHVVQEDPRTHVFCVFCGKGYKRREKARNNCFHKHIKNCPSYLSASMKFGARCYLCEELFPLKCHLLNHSLKAHVFCDDEDYEALTKSYDWSPLKDRVKNLGRKPPRPRSRSDPYDLENECRMLQPDFGVKFVTSAIEPVDRVDSDPMYLLENQEENPEESWTPRIASITTVDLTQDVNAHKEEPQYEFEEVEEVEETPDGDIVTVHILPVSPQSLHYETPGMRLPNVPVSR